MIRVLALVIAAAANVYVASQIAGHAVFATFFISAVIGWEISCAVSDARRRA